MDTAYANSTRSSLNRSFQLREAALMVFRDPVPAEFTRLLHLSPEEWQPLVRWLDTSGLALYFIDRVKALNRLDTIPEPILDRLRKNLADNSRRMDGMIAESVAIQRRFQDAGLSYAVLKGFSLWPISVQKLELRSQIDHDFLVAEEHAIEARRILEVTGYRLTAIAGKGGRSWEFESSETCAPSLNNLYKSGMRRSADLHIEIVDDCGTSRLSRTHPVFFHGVNMPVLSPVDLFLGQGLHVYQHVCCEFVRAAHLLEFYRHIVARRHDGVFWSRLRERVADDPVTCVRLGMVILLISRVMGRFAPEELTRWTVGRLPSTATLWVERYGLRTALASFPGSKLYLLLQEEMRPMGLAAKRSRTQALLPSRLPRFISHGVPGETFSARMKRYQVQLRFYFFRARFHVVEGVHYLRESILWRRHLNRVSQ